MKWWYEMRSNVCTYFPTYCLYQLSHWHSSLDAWHEHHEPGNDCEPYGHMWLHRSGSIGLHPNQTLENTGYCLEISWTPMNKRTTCLYCHWCSSIPPELPGCVVPSLEKSGYTSSTEKYLDNLWNPDTNREPQAASHAWWIIHTTGHHLDIETDVAKPRRTGAGYPAARWQWWNGPIWPCLAPCGQVVFFSLFHVCFVFSTKTFLKLLMVSVMMVAQWWWRIGGFGMQIWIKGWPSRRARASGNDMAANYIVLMISIGSYINNKFIDPTIILNN